MAKNKKSVLRNFLIRFLLVLLLVVVLAAALFVGSIYSGVFGPLPSTDDLANIRDENATLVYSSDHILIGKIFAKNRTPVSREVLPQYLIDALVCTEDVRFYNHNGIDNRSLLRVIIKSILMGNRASGGGSTIDQQLAKNLYGRKEFGVLTLPVNKIREAIIAIRLEKVYSKDDILLLYLNSVPFGEDVYGIEAAANRYFNKTVAELDIEEAAMLVGLLKGNTYYNPRLHPNRALERRNLVLGLMNDQAKLKDEVYNRLVELPLALDYSNLSYEGPAQYFLFQVEKRAREILSEIENKTNAQYNIESDGLIITTTLDSKLQNMALMAIRKQVPAMQKLFNKDPEVKNKKNKLNDWFDDETIEKRELWTWDGVKVQEISKLDSAWHYESMLNAGVLIIDPKTGQIKVWVGGNHFRYLPYDLVLAKRMLASAFKPILYATAFKGGIKPCDYLDNEEKVYEEYDDWAPKNYDGTSGDETAVWYSLVHSLNIPTVDLYFKVGHKNLEKMCYQLGFDETPPDNPSVALGTMNISLYEAIRAYAAFANHGILDELSMIEKIADTNGNVIYEAGIQAGDQVIEEEIAETVTAILQKVINEGTGIRIRSQFGIRADLAGKTGTSQDYSDAWFFSYTPEVACGIWVGARDPAIHFSSGANGSGSALALPIAGNLFKELEKQPDMRRQYLGTFNTPAAYFDMLDCPGTRTKGVWNRFFENLFKRKKEQENVPDTTTVMEESKVKKFFRDLFKKKQ